MAVKLNSHVQNPEILRISANRAPDIAGFLEHIIPSTRRLQCGARDWKQRFGEMGEENQITALATKIELIDAKLQRMAIDSEPHKWASMEAVNERLNQPITPQLALELMENGGIKMTALGQPHDLSPEVDTSLLMNRLFATAEKHAMPIARNVDQQSETRDTKEIMFPGGMGDFEKAVGHLVRELANSLQPTQRQR